MEEIDHRLEMMKHVLNAFITGGGSDTLAVDREHVPAFATALLRALGAMGWTLEYDPAVLEATIKAAVENLPPAPAGLPVRPPEELVEP